MNFLIRCMLSGFFVCMSLTMVHGQSDHLLFQHLVTNNGLSHPCVRCIMQDDLGFMWFGTFDGLNKYDGYSFTVYRHLDGDSNSIPSNTIRSIYKDTQGNLWIGTTRGLCLYDHDRDLFVNYNKERGYKIGNSDITSIFKDSKGNLWVGTEDQGLFLLDTLKKRCTQYTHLKDDPNSLGSNDVRQIFEDSKHNLWISTLGAGLNILNRDNKTFTHYIHRKNDPNSIIGNSVYSIVEDVHGYLWFACLGNGLSSIHVDQLDKQSFKNYKHNPQDIRSLCDKSVRVLCADRNEGLWIGSQNEGIDFFNYDKKTFYHYKNNIYDAKSINDNSIYSFYSDRVGDLWIGTYSGGINIIQYTNQAFRHYNNVPGGTNQLNNNYVWEFAEDQKGNIWIATDGGGLHMFIPRVGNFKHFNSRNSNLNKNGVLSVCIGTQNDIWIGTWAGGFSLFDELTKSFRAFTHENSGLSDNNVLDIADGRDGNLWLATKGGLNKFNKATNRFIIYTQENSDIVNNQLEVVKVDSSGNILIGSTNGFCILNPRKNTFSNYRHSTSNINSLSEDFVTSIFEENNRTLWISTANGLNTLNRETQEISHYFIKDGLPSNFVYGVEKDNRGFLWISTDRGLSQFNPKTKYFKNYTRKDGLQENVLIKKSHHKYRDGRLCFGGTDGFDMFDPNEVTDNPSVPPIVITDFEIFNKHIKPGTEETSLKKHINRAEEIILSYKQNVFSFEYSALNYVASLKNQYAYLLEGFEKDWNYVGNRHMATYTNLSPGEYTFRVKGSNNDGVWNEKGTAIRITITPPFWQTSWFRVIGIILVLSVLITGYKIRTARIRAHNRELGQRVLERTAQLEAANKELEAFVYSVSHDLRAPLRAIDGFTNILVEDNEQLLDEESKRKCAVICSETKRMGQLIDDLLSFSHISHAEMQVSPINMERLVNAVFQELTTPESREHIDFQVASLPSAIGDLTLIRQVWMNLLSNAIKFSSKRERALIEVSYQQDGQRIIYSVRDNGAGFDMQYADKLFTVFWRFHSKREFEGTGVGLAIVQRLIHRHGGDVWAESQVGKGAAFYFTCGK